MDSSAVPRTSASVAARVEASYARASELGDNPVFIHRVAKSDALARARQLEACSEPLPLKGLTFAVKDNIDVAGLPTTAACPQFAYRAQHSAHVVQRLIDAGAILVGKTNLDQFATGLVGTRSPYGACRNAVDDRYISGGSSSGSAVAVAKKIAAFALGTDTAGSGRVPAAFNGVVGLKPTRGLLSTAGVVPACRSLDCVSIFAPNVAGALQVLDIAEGFDPADPYSRPTQRRALDVVTPRVAIPRVLEFFGDASYEALFTAAVQRMEKLGARVIEIDFAAFIEVQSLLYDGAWLAERTVALQDFLEQHADALHPVTRKVLEGGARFSAADVFRAQHRLAWLQRQCDAAMGNAEVLLVPGAPTIYTIEQVEDNPLELNTRLGTYTNFANLLDMAAITVPAGRRDDGIPFGITLLGPAFTDRALASIAARFNGEAHIASGASNMQLAVVGAHLSGMPLNHQLTSRGARLVRTARTAAAYRLYALADQTPPKPGLVRVANGHGAQVELEVWEINAAEFGAFVAEVPPPLGIGTLQLDDGECVKGFVCESYAVVGQQDISGFGGWRNYVQSLEGGRG